MNETLTEATRDHYRQLIGSIGDGYDAYRWQGHPVSRSHYRQTRKAVEHALAGPGRAGHLLEIGCGPGTWTGICLANSERVTVVDLSAEMLGLVRKRFHDAPLETICSDFLAPDLEFTGPCDAIFSARALEYMEDKAAVVARCARLLGPGGRLLIITKNPAWRDKRREERGARCRAGERIHQDWIGRQELEDHFRREGLEDVVTRPVCIGSYYPPLSSGAGIRACDLLQTHLYRRALPPLLLGLCESYLTVGRKPFAWGGKS